MDGLFQFQVYFTFGAIALYSPHLLVSLTFIELELYNSGYSYGIKRMLRRLGGADYILQLRLGGAVLFILFIYIFF